MGRKKEGSRERKGKREIILPVLLFELKEPYHRLVKVKPGSLSSNTQSNLILVAVPARAFQSREQG